LPKSRIRPAFVVTLAALAPIACQKQQPHGNPPPPTATTTIGKVPSTTNTDEVSANPPPIRTTREVRDPLPPQHEQYKGQVDYAKVKRLNPHGRENRLIMAAKDGTCFIQVPIDPSAPIGPPGTGLRSEQVACPDVMQDPAWDTCLYGDILRLESGDCVCERMGNPPPPPSKAECPK
jgi:hypothetical protein